MGPTPTPPTVAPSGAVVDPARARLLRLIGGRWAGDEASVSDLAAEAGGHPNTTRHHLRALVAAGLVEERHGTRAGGRGRPATRYAVTAAGRDAVSPGERGMAAQEYVALAAAFAERLAERDGDPGADARAIGHAWGAGLVAQDASDRAGRSAAATGADDPSAERVVVGLLDRLGFSPALVETGAEGAAPDPTALDGVVPDDAALEYGAPDPAAGDTTVLLRTCPLLDAARRHPEVVCEVHRGLVSGALDALDASSEGVRLEAFARPGACVLGLPRTLVG